MSTQTTSLQRAHAKRLKAEMRSGVVRRAATFTDRKREASRKACRKGSY